MRSKVLIAVAVTLNIAATAMAFWLSGLAQMAVVEAATHQGSNEADALVGLSWVVSGAVIGWLRPRNALGWLLLGVGSCQVFSVVAGVYGGLGVVTSDPDWPLASLAAWLASALWLPGLAPLACVLPAIYPDGRLAGRRWRWPVWSAVAGIALLTVGLLLDQTGYHEIATGPSPLSLSVPVAVSVVYTAIAAVLFLGGTLAIWGLSIVRLIRAKPPQRQQLAWLVVVVVVAFTMTFLPSPQWLFAVVLCLIPAAIGVGIFRYNLLGIEFVLRRGLLYAALTSVVVGVYLAVTAAAGTGMDHGPVPGVVAAALVAVGLAPLRERFQRVVDRLVYGERRDPMRAVTRLGDQVAVAPEHDLLTSVLTSVAEAVRAPGACLISADGRVRSSTGSIGDGVDLSLVMGGRDVGTLRVAARSPGEIYGDGERRVLAALAPQVSAVVRALDLAEAVEAQRDHVLEATHAERDRLRRDLHDGLGPSLSGVGLGLQALSDAVDEGDHASSRELVDRMRSEIGAAVGEVRRILDGLRPAPLDDLGLAEALRAKAALAGSACPVTVTVSGSLPALRPDVETAAYRITLEALTNVVKHSRATRAQVDVDADDDVLRVQVVDNGLGAAEGCEPRGTTGLGIASMRRRAEVLGGSLTVDSNDNGTTVLAALPLKPG